MNENAKSSIAALRKNSSIAYIASVDNEGFPVMRAMLVLEHDSIKTHYFSTNTSSSKVGYYQNNPKASVYYCDPQNYKGVLFAGITEVCTDQETKDFLWREGFECYYPKGVTDPDYCVLKFTATHGSYYHGLNSAKFKIEELEEAEREELSQILTKFAESGWDLIDGPSKAWLEGRGDFNKLIEAINEADNSCGSCGCEFDPLYKRALALKAWL